MTTLGPGGKLALLGDVFDPSNSGAGLAAFDSYLGITGNAPIYASLHSAFPASVQTDNELAYAGTTPYARVQMARNSAGAVWTVDQANYLARNAAGLAFPSHSPAGPTAAKWLGLGTTALPSAGKLIARTPILTTGSGWATVSCVDTTTDLLSMPKAYYTAYGLADTWEVAVMRLSNEALPSPLSSGTEYFVTTGSVTVNTYDVTFTLSTVSNGGAVVNFTETNSFRMIKLTPLSLVAGSTPSFPALSIAFAAA